LIENIPTLTESYRFRIPKEAPPKYIDDDLKNERFQLKLNLCFVKLAACYASKFIY